MDEKNMTEQKIVPLFKSADEARDWVISLINEWAMKSPNALARHPDTGELTPLSELVTELKHIRNERMSRIASKQIDPRFSNDLMQDEGYRIAVTTWVKGQIDRSFRGDDNYKRACDALLKYELSDEDRMKERIKDWSVGTAGSGGSLVPTAFYREVWTRIGLYNQLLNVATVLPTTGKIQVPTGTGRATAYYPGENTTPSGDAGLTTGSITLDPNPLIAYLKLSRKLFEANGIDMTDFLARKFSEGLAYKMLYEMTNGDGDDCPTGFANHTAYSSVTAVSLASTSFSFDDLINLEFAINEEYAPFCAYMLSRKGLKQTAKLKDQDDNPIWNRPAEGRPGLLNGQPYIVNSTISNTIDISGENTTEIYWGDWQAYHVAVMQDMRLALSDQAGTAFLDEQVWVKMTAYNDGQLADENAIVYLSGVDAD